MISYKTYKDLILDTVLGEAFSDDSLLQSITYPTKITNEGRAHLLEGNRVSFFFFLIN